MKIFECTVKNILAITIINLTCDSEIKDTSNAGELFLMFP